MIYGLIGEKLGHSYSKQIHEAFADYKYDLMPLRKEEVHDFMTRKEFAGINVTIPYKQTVIPYLDEIDPLAKEIGAVNTIVNHDGRLKGYNTDFYGFLYTLNFHNIDVKGKKCLVLGTGGTSNTVQTVLKHEKAGEILLVSRTSRQDVYSYDDIYREHQDAQIIINTTPVGMYPAVDASPLDLKNFKNCKTVVDVIFNPTPTLLTIQARELGMYGINGLQMLVAQAKQAAEYFTSKSIEDSMIDIVYHKIKGLSYYELY